MALIQVTTVNTSAAGASNAPALAGVAAGSLLVACTSYVQQTNGNVPTAAGWEVACRPASQVFLAGVAWTGCAIFYKENAPSGANTSTIVPGASSTGCIMSAILAEFATGLPAGALNVVNSAASASATTGNSSTTLVTARPSELVISCLGLNDAAGGTFVNLGISDPSTTGYASLGVLQDTTPGLVGFQASYKYVTTLSTQTANWTWTNASAYVGAIVAFMLAPKPSPGDYTRFPVKSLRYTNPRPLG